MIKGIIQNAGSEFRHFICNTKMILIVFSIIFICESLLGKVQGLCELSDLKLSFLEPYLMVSSMDAYAIAIPLVYIVLMSGFPSKSSFNYFSMIRISRMQWFMSELLFLLLSSISYLLIYLAGFLIYMHKSIVWSNSWSRYMLNFRELYPEDYIMNQSYFMKTDMMTHGSPLSIFVHSVLLMIAMLFVMSLVQMLFSFLEKRMVGMAVSVGLTLLSSFLIYSSGNFKWLFPMTHTNIAVHFNGFLAVKNFTITKSYLYFAGLIVFLLIANLLLLRKKNMGVEQ